MKQIITLVLTIIHSMSMNAQTRELIEEGHRGCRGLMPENTIAAMKHGLDLGAGVLELDVVISSDRKVVVSHDNYMSAAISLKPSGDTISAAEEKSLLLYQMTYADIKKYDVGSRHNSNFPEQQNFPAYKPLLSALIDSVDAYAKQKGMQLLSYNIEIKSQPKTDDVEHPAPQPFVDLVMEVLKARDLENRMNIQSFDARPLQLIHQQFPAVKLAYLTANSKSIATNLEELGFKPDLYSPHYKSVTAEGVSFCHAQAIKIIPWTVNTRPEIAALKAIGVDGIITDYPNLL